MISISLNDSNHEFHKTNLVTKKGGYDEYACKCGVHGKRFGVSEFLQVNKKSDKGCPLALPKSAPVGRVKIINFTGVSREFENLTNGSEHDIVPCPKEQMSKYANDVWVMGVTEPVRLLKTEYQKI